MVDLALRSSTSGPAISSCDTLELADSLWRMLMRNRILLLNKHRSFCIHPFSRRLSSLVQSCSGCSLIYWPEEAGCRTPSLRTD